VGREIKMLGNFLVIIILGIIGILGIIKYNINDFIGLFCSLMTVFLSGLTTWTMIISHTHFGTYKTVGDEILSFFIKNYEPPTRRFITIEERRKNLKAHKKT